MHVHLTSHCQIHELHYVCEYSRLTRLALLVHLLLLDLCMLPTLTSLETSNSTFVTVIIASYIFFLLLLFHHVARNNLSKYFKRMLFVEFLCVKRLQQTNNGAALMHLFYMHGMFTLNYSVLR